MRTWSFPWVLLTLAGCTADSPAQGGTGLKETTAGERSAAPQGIPEAATLAAAVPEMRLSFRDVQAQSNDAALRNDLPGELVLLEWSKRHLTWDQLREAKRVDVGEELAAGRSLHGMVGCVFGQLIERGRESGATRFELRDGEGRLSGGWVVGELESGAPDGAEVCGTVVGARNHGSSTVTGLEIVGLSRSAGAPGSETPSGRLYPAGPWPAERNLGTSSPEARSEWD